MRNNPAPADNGGPFGARADLSRRPVLVVAAVYAAWFGVLVWMATQVASAR